MRFIRRKTCGCVETVLRNQNGREIIMSTKYCPADKAAVDEHERKVQEVEARARDIIAKASRLSSSPERAAAIVDVAMAITAPIKHATDE